MASPEKTVSSTKSLIRRHLKPESLPFRSSPAAALKQNTLQAANATSSSAREATYRIPFLTQHGVEYFDIVDPCSLLASNDDPRVEDQVGIQGLDWSNIDPSLLANCTSMPSSAPSFVGGRGGVVCGTAEDGDSKSVLVKYVYKVETMGVQSAQEFLPGLEGRILNEMQSLCGSGSSVSSSATGAGSSAGSSGAYSFVGIESAPDDVEITTSYCAPESSNADDCFMIDGAVTINIDSSSDTVAAKNAARESIVTAMDSGSLLDRASSPEVIEVQYLDETYEDYLLSQGGGNNILCPNAPADATGTKEVVVTYVYEVETAAAQSTSSFLPTLEGEILKQLVSKCESEGYTLISIKSTPDDVATTGRCIVDSSSADDCHVIDGALTLEVDGSSSSTAAEESIRESIIIAMDNDDLLNPTAMPEVIDVQYLDKTYNDYLKNTTVQSIACNASDLFIVSSNTPIDTSKALVMYVYEVETANVSTTDSFLPILEENILMELGKKCDMLGMYGVMAMHSTPDDVEMKTGPCSIESPSSDNCFIIEGGLTLDLVSSFNSTWAEEQTHSIIKGSMDNDDLLNSTTIPEVIRVRYLDNVTFDEYMGGFTSQDGGIVVWKTEEEGENLGVIVGSLVGVICLILLALLLIQRRRKRKQMREAQEAALRRKQAIMAKEMELDLDDDLDDLVAGIESSTAKRSANAATDPDGHFHLGNHHYTADGVRYWSPNCALCIAAKASGALDQEENELEDGEDEHDFDELSYDFNATKKFTDFNIHDLGKHHSSMHVRECKSKTCQGCKDNLNGVVFIQSKKTSPVTPSKINNKSIML